MFRIVLVVLFGFSFIFRASAQNNSNENPFVQFDNPQKSDKNFHNFSQQLTSLLQQHPNKQDSLKNLIVEAYQQTENRMFYYDAKIRELHENWGKGEYTFDDFVEKMFELQDEADGEKLSHIRLYILYYVYINYRINTDNYERIFFYAKQLEQIINSLNINDYPECIWYLIEIVSIHYSFEDYQKSSELLHKIIAYPELANKVQGLNTSYNTLALINKNDNNYAKADSFLNLILENNKNLNKNLNKNWSTLYSIKAWNAIAIGNIGDLKVLLGRDDEAIPMLKKSLTEMSELKDFRYACGKAKTLAEIYLRKKNLPLAEKYLRTAIEYNNLHGVAKENRMWEIYPTLSKLYAAKGNGELAAAYLDSAMRYEERHEKEFDIKKLLRFEQTIHKEEIEKEQIQKRHIQTIVIALSIFTIIVVVFSLMIAILYRKKRNAYKELVKKAKLWAGVETDESKKTTDDDFFETAENTDELSSAADETSAENIDTPDEYDTKLFGEIKEFLEKSEIYINENFSLQQLSAEMKMSPNYISQAINRCTGNGFSALTNSYRVKHAVKLMSQKDEKRPLVEEISMNSGFADRTSFYRAFKKIVGMTPSAYLKSQN
jgi:AraC-like DNA-binding protein